jgi:signal transduction histidine kinase
MKLELPRIVAAQRLQVWLLVMTLVALLVTSLLVLDLARTRRTALLAETNNNLRYAAEELRDAARNELGAALPPALAELDRRLAPVSYKVLQGFLDVEGGYLWQGSLYGHSFPSYTEPGSILYQPPMERQLLEQALAASAASGKVEVASSPDGDDMVLVAAVWDRTNGLNAWALRRMINFSDQREHWRRIWLVATMCIALVAVTMVLRLSFKMQRGFLAISEGLDQLRLNPSYRFEDKNPDLRPIIQALNNMAESRERLESDLRREDRLRAMGRLVAGVAHEIRNPLNSIRLTVRVLARRLAGQAEAREPIRLIIDEIDRLNRILGSLSAFRLDEAPKLRQQPLRPLLEQTLALVAAQAGERQIEVHLDMPQDHSASVDADLLKQAVINLLLNAIDASPRGAQVLLEARATGGRVSLSVEDQGPGLTPLQMEHIFEAFYTTKPGGTGLGLAVTRTLLEKMNASIEAGNGSRGARFVIKIPREGVTP